MSKTARGHDRARRIQSKMAASIDDLAEFERFRAELLPKLRKMVSSGASEKDIYSVSKSMAAARAVTIAATEPDSAKALAAIREILDRHGGKATESKEVLHKHSNLKDEELNSLILSSAAEVSAEKDESDDLPN